MSTRSLIAKECPDGSVVAVYCHWDGYPSNNGKILLENYKTDAKVANLLMQGSISSLGKTYIKRKGHSYANPVDGCTVFYKRDRGDEDCGPEAFDNVDALDEADMWQEYEYLFSGSKWSFRHTGGDWKPLTKKDCAD